MQFVSPVLGFHFFSFFLNVIVAWCVPVERQEQENATRCNENEGEMEAK